MIIPQKAQMKWKLLSCNFVRGGKWQKKQQCGMWNPFLTDAIYGLFFRYLLSIKTRDENSQAGYAMRLS